MKVLFVHNNFPAQFANLATTLAACEDVELAALGSETARAFPGVRVVRYATPRSLAQAHTFARRFDNEARRAEETLYAATKLVKDGFSPDVIFVHPGWGEALPLRALFPSAKIVVYCEYYYRSVGGDIGFDPEFPAMGVDGHVALDARNAATLLALASCDAAIAPTEWQKSTFPSIFHPLIEVAHEGIDTDFFVPDSNASLRLPNGVVLNAGEEVLTYTARNLEPLRGFHSFMRALPRVLEARPAAQVVIVGETGVSYGQPPRRHANWKEALLAELGGRLDRSRVTFLPRMSYSEYVKVLQVSAAHVYLTYPFVLSWSMLEAMSAGCLMIGSDTPPVCEVIDGKNGVVAPMLNVAALANTIADTLERREDLQNMRSHARRTIVERYDAKAVAAPQMLRFIERLTLSRWEPADRALAAPLEVA